MLIILMTTTILIILTGPLVARVIVSITVPIVVLTTFSCLLFLAYYLMTLPTRIPGNEKLLIHGYYGYGNRGDELLLLGLLEFLAQFPQKHAYQQVCIRVADAKAVQSRLDRHSLSLPFELILDDSSWRKDLKTVVRVLYRYRGADVLWGAGEVLSERRGVFHGGWNYPLQYLPWVLRSRHIICGGIETAKKRYQKLLYRFVLPRAHTIVSRDAVSYATARTYHQDAQLFQDRGERYIHHHATGNTNDEEKIHPIDQIDSSIQSPLQDLFPQMSANASSSGVSSASSSPALDNA